ncbi:hypothetical protein CN376_22915 [Bacillus cereus]|nr:hypothetical protein CN376_22915 [Bacillus cereus]PFR12587.1 hypothetical protein COK30_13640 [Bacillus cereus]
MISCRVLMRQGHTEVISMKSKRGVRLLMDDIATQENPEKVYHSWERPVRIGNITRVISVEEEN